MLVNGETSRSLSFSSSLYDLLSPTIPRIEAASYFLASDDAIDQSKAQEYRDAMDHMIDLIEKAQQPDGYLNIYFTVVDKDGKFKNLRDMHEMCESVRPKSLRRVELIRHSIFPSQTTRGTCWKLRWHITDTLVPENS
jgi:hypothetical protein